MIISYSETKLLTARRHMMGRALFMAFAGLVIVLIVHGTVGESRAATWSVALLVLFTVLSQLALYFRAPLLHRFELTEIGLHERWHSRASREERLYRWEDIWDVNVARDREGVANAVRLRTAATRDAWVDARKLDETVAPNEFESFVAALEARPRGSLRPDA